MPLMHQDRKTLEMFVRKGNRFGAARVCRT